MLERSCFHTDREEPRKHKSGWFFQTFHFEVDGTGEYKPGTRIEIRACDYDHALRQAKSWGRRDGFKVVKEV